ncbi:glycoside hydrolase family 5 protein [Plicaturopsis crispa FD-325 SS-3]|nr:glycoside hydrolase family 5 protein [Plicaturopsis crispa FD-325 SS-3]
MLVTADGFSALLQTLSLTQGLFKPTVSSVVNTIGDVSTLINGTAMNATGTLLGGAGGGQINSFTGSTASSGTMEDAACQVEPYDIPGPIDETFPPFDEASANIYRYRQQQSVNLGSWFVHENWMTPSLFKCAAGKKLSELDIASGWGSTTNAKAVLERHWDTFVNQSDFEYLASIGINTVRLPIGYWNLGPYYCHDTPYAAVADVYESAWSRVVRAINMAGEAGLGVLVDLHGAVGSQNGQPHSGISDGTMNLFSSEDNVNKTISALAFLMQQLGSVTNVVGIQILNEPQNVPELPGFYTQAIAAMRSASPEAASFPLYIHDGFDLQLFSDYVANHTDFIVQDNHSYFVYTASDVAESGDQHSGDVHGSVASALQKASDNEHRNIVVDEWSCALAPQSLSKEADPNASRKDFCTGQMEVYTNTTAGWGFWSYNKEDCVNDPGWCFKAAVGNSLPNTFFSYGQAQARNPTQTQALSSMSMSRHRHRLASLHHRRQSPSSSSSSSSSNGTLFDYDGYAMTMDQIAIVKGYSDGFMTAKLFATYDMSRLGFAAQYINDSVKALGPDVIEVGTEHCYTEWFMNGLQDGQAVVFGAVGAQNNV